LSKNEKVEQHMRKKTHKHDVLMFWVEGGVPLVSFLFVSSVFPLEFSQYIRSTIHTNQTIFVYPLFGVPRWPIEMSILIGRR